MNLNGNQRHVLKCLFKHGAWVKGCCWSWDSATEMKRWLSQLERKGLVRLVKPQFHEARYELTDAGFVIGEQEYKVRHSAKRIVSPTW